MSSEITTLHSYDTELNADCVVWCPHPGKEDLLVCTSYQLTSQHTKVGGILLFSVTPAAFKLLHSVNGLPGIFDAKWSPKNWNSIYLATADSQGVISIYTLNKDLKLEPLTSTSVFPDISNCSALYVDFSPHDCSSILTSSSNGWISILKFSNSSLTCVQKVEGHKFEAWVASFDENRPGIIYSGGDDGVMKCFDLRTDSIVLSWKDGSSHSAGVTSFLTNIANPYNLVSGSYDEQLLLWDIRALKPKVLSSLGLGGGVWRLKSHMSDHSRVAAACMFASFKTLCWGSLEFTIVASYRDEEECLAYGVDWAVNEPLMAACSFYDHKLTIAHVNFQKD